MSTFITLVDLGRMPTAEELPLRDAEIANCVAAGTTNGSVASTVPATEPATGPGVRIWSTIDAANSYVAWAQANYDPAPVRAVALTI